MKTLTVLYLFDLLADAGKYFSGIATFFLAINALKKKKKQKPHVNVGIRPKRVR